MKSTQRQMIFLALALIMLLAPGTVQAAPDEAVPNSDPGITSLFNDINSTDPDLIYINYLAHRQIMKGYTDGGFHPREGLTRAQAATVIAQVINLTDCTLTPIQFNDLSPDHWAAAYINTVAAAGYLKGYPGGSFQPDKELTRAEGISLVLRLSKQSTGETTLPQLKDVDNTHWAAGPIATALAAQMIGINSDQKFLPENPLTRSSLARALAVLLIKDPELYEEELTGILKPVTGQITLIRKGESRLITAETLLEPGDTIKSSSESTGEINYPDGSAVLIKENTELSIKASQGRRTIKKDGTPGTAVDWLNLDMKQGTIFTALATQHHSELEQEKTVAAEKYYASLEGIKLLAAGEKAPWYQMAQQKKVKVKVDMPWGTAAVRGTFISITVAADGRANVSCLTGDAEVTSNNQITVALQGGQSSSLNSINTTPEPPTPMSTEERQQFTQEKNWLEDTARKMDENQETPEVSPPAEEQPQLQEQQQEQQQTPQQQPQPEQTTLENVQHALNNNGSQPAGNTSNSTTPTSGSIPGTSTNNGGSSNGGSIGGSGSHNDDDSSPVIRNIDNPSANIISGQTYTPPATLTAAMSNGANRQVPVSWDNNNPDTKSPGTVTINGTVSGYSRTITLTLTIEAPAISIAIVEDLNITVKEGESYQPPGSIAAQMTDGSTKQVAVSWDNNNPDTSSPGTITINGSAEGYSGTVKLTIIIERKTGEPLNIIPGQPLTLPGGIQIDLGNILVPEGAQVTVNEVSPPNTAGSGLEAGGKIVEISFENLSITQPVTLSLPVNPGIDITKAGIYYYNGTSWEYQISQAGNGVVTAQVSHFSVYGVLLDNTPPTKPVLSKGNIGSQGVELNFEAFDNTRVEKYEIYRNGELLATVNTPNYVDQAVEKGQSYTYQVIAIDQNNNQSEMSVPLEIQVLGSDKEILSFVLHEQAGDALIDNVNHHIDIQVKEETQLTNLTPNIEISEGATIEPASGVSRDFNNPVVYTVTAADGSSQEWTVTVHVEDVDYPTLSSISISEVNNTGNTPVELTPAFSPEQEFYSATVSKDTKQVSITASLTEPGDLIKINRQEAGQDPVIISIGTGETSIQLEVVSDDSSRVYTVTIKREALGVSAELSTLSITPGSLSPVFNKEITSYSASVGYEVSSISVSAAAADPNARITINNETENKGSASANVPLNEGSNYITLRITAEDGITSKDYTLSITRDSAPVQPPPVNTNQPPVASVTTATIAVGGDVTTARSTRTGTIYLVLDSANITTPEAAEAEVNAGTAQKATVAAPNIDIVISTLGLALGTYKVVAADSEGDFSAESDGTIIINNFAGGTGTEADPYIVTTAQSLDQVRDDLSACYKLGADIDLDVAPYNTGEGWLPIGDYFENPFLGKFDGAGYVITNLCINRPETDYVGLFGYINTGDFNIESSGDIVNVQMENASISGRYAVGTLAGMVGLGTISNCHAECIVASDMCAGGLVGILGTDWIGNPGDPPGGKINYSYSTGNVNGTGMIGGLAGLCNGFIYDSYSTANVNGIGNDGVGALAGMATSRVYNSYATGNVSGPSGTGGLIGWYGVSPSDVLNSYYDTNTTNQMDNTGKGIPKTTAEMKQQATFEGWDFTGIWTIDEGNDYPRLWLNPNAMPAANNATITGTATVGETLTGSYTYSDVDNDPEGTSTFQWYRGTLADGSNKEVIEGAVAHAYILNEDDTGKYIFFEVTPVAQSGTLTGTRILSSGLMVIDNRPIQNYGTISTVVGNGTEGYSGDGGSATSAQLCYPTEVAFDSNGNMYISDDDNNCVRKVDTFGEISTAAGNGSAGYSGDGGSANSATLNGSWGVELDSRGNMYISDPFNHCIRMVDTSGKISTAAGNGSAGYSGDGGSATSAQLNGPNELTFDNSGNLYVADVYSNCIRMVDTSGKISTVAGNGSAGYSGDGGLATAAQLYNPTGVSLDNDGNLYIADRDNNCIRKVEKNSRIISTVAGNGSRGYSGDGGSATSARLYFPWGLSFDNGGNMYIAEYGNNCIRKVDKTGIISTCVGNGNSGYSGDGGSATTAQLNSPEAVAFDNNGNMYITDTDNHCIRKVVLGDTNHAPTATNVNITGTAIIGQTLTGSYTYSDLENDYQGISTFKWYRGTMADGSDKVAIEGATRSDYIVTEDDVDKYIFFEVTPVAQSGTLQGVPTLSPASEKVFAITNNVAGDWDGNNPSGVWSYGWILGLGQEFNLLTTYSTTFQDSLGWEEQNISQVWKNTTNSTGYGVNPGEVSLHPGAGGQYSVVRWTSPVTGTIKISGCFGAGDTGIMSYYIFKNSTISLFQNQNTYANGVFSIIEGITKGETVDFIVGEGYSAGNTPLNATINISLTQILTTPGNYSLPVPGSQSGSTRIANLNLPDGATKWQIKVQDEALPNVPELNSIMEGFTDYTAADDISVTVGQHVLLMATDADGKVKAYADIAVTAPMAGMIYNQDGQGFSEVIASNPLGSSISMTGYNGWPSGTSNVGNYAFASGVFDGQNIWLIPFNADRVVKVDKDTGIMTGYNGWPAGISNIGNAAFVGGVFDGKNIWLIPCNANRIVKVDKDTGIMTGYNGWLAGITNIGNYAFVGGVFDGQNIWLIPLNADRVVKIDKDSGVMTGYTSWPVGTANIGNYAFQGGIFDDQNIWLIPYNADRVVKIDKDTGIMTGYSNWPAGTTNIGSQAFIGGVCDGQSIWLIPYKSDRVVKIDKYTGAMTGYNGWPAGITNIGNYAFAGGVFDGKNIWLIPLDADRVVKVDKDTGAMIDYNGWPAGISNIGNCAFAGGVCDGQNIWLIPHSANSVVKLSTVAGSLSAGTNYSLPVPGSSAGKTQIASLDLGSFAPAATKWQVKVDSQPFMAPDLNSVISGAEDYTAGDDISVTAGQHILLMATDDEGKVKAYSDLTVSAEQIKTDIFPPAYQSAAISNGNKTVTLTFDEGIVNNTADAETLKAAVTFAADGTNFIALGSNDTVAVSDSIYLQVTFENTLTGSSNKIRIAANALKDTEGNVLNSEVETGSIVAATLGIATTAGTLEVQTGAEQTTVCPVYTLGEDYGVGYGYGSVTFTLPEGIEMGEDDEVMLRHFNLPAYTDVTLVDGTNCSISINGNTVSIITNGRWLKTGDWVSLVLRNNTLSAGQYTFSAVGDADGPGTDKLPTAGTGSETAVYIVTE